MIELGQLEDDSKELKFLYLDHEDYRYKSPFEKELYWFMKRLDGLYLELDTPYDGLLAGKGTQLSDKELDILFIK